MPPYRHRARRPRRPRPPALTEAEEDRLWDAQAEIETIDTQVADLYQRGLLKAMLFEQNDQCLFLRQDVLEQWHVAAMQWVQDPR